MRAALVFLIACTSTPLARRAAEPVARLESGPAPLGRQVIPSDLIWNGEYLVFAASRPVVLTSMVVLWTFSADGSTLLHEQTVVPGGHPRLAFSGAGYGLAYDELDPSLNVSRVHFARLDNRGQVIVNVDLGTGDAPRIAWNATRREYLVAWARSDQRAKTSVIELARFSERGDAPSTTTIEAIDVQAAVAYGMISGLAAVGDHYALLVQPNLHAIITDGAHVIAQYPMSDGWTDPTEATMLADRDGLAVAYHVRHMILLTRIIEGRRTTAPVLETALYTHRDPVIAGTVVAPWVVYQVAPKDDRWSDLRLVAAPVVEREWTRDLVLGNADRVDDEPIQQLMAISTSVPGGFAVGYEVGDYADLRVRVFKHAAIAR